MAFDRYDPHLYSFYFPKAPGRGAPSRPLPKEYSAPMAFDDRGLFQDERRFNAAETRLDDLRLRVGQRFEYLFDFGDCWLHEVVVEKISPVTPESRYGIIEKSGASPPQYEGDDE
jgi:Plasmid pRiA4b ORF-3-like protein